MHSDLAIGLDALAVTGFSQRASVAEPLKVVSYTSQTYMRKNCRTHRDAQLLQFWSALGTKRKFLSRFFMHGIVSLLRLLELA